MARLEWITHNLLDLSRLDAGIEVLDLAEQDAGDLTRSVVSSFQPLAHEKQIELALVIPPDPVELRCDRARVEMALSNLLQNALKFTPSGGRVDVKLEEAEATLCWSVHDDGPGIPPEDQPHIFERFFRGAHPGVEGSGLGLAIVHSIAKAHGGKVWVESQPGAGSNFLIELPRL